MQEVNENQTTDPIAPSQAPATGAPVAPQGPTAAGPAVPAPYAGFWVRLVAVIIDAILIGIVTFPLGFIFPSDPLDPNPSNLNLRNSIITLIQIAYFTTMNVLYGGTIGKKAMGLKVTNESGGRLNWGRSLLRESVGKFVSTIALGAGFIWVAFDSKKQGWHDKIAGTFVVKSK